MTLDDLLFELSNIHAFQMSAATLVHFDARTDDHGVAVAARLQAAYRYSIAQENQRDASSADLWTDIVNVHMKTFVDCLTSGTPAQLNALLSNFGKEYIWFGGISTGIDSSNHRGKDEAKIASSYFDKLLGVAESIGVLPAESPELGLHGSWGNNMRLNPEQVVSLIEEELGIDILPPTGILPLAGLKIRDGALHYRHINALYTAIRVKSLTDKSDHICEYGGGLGFIPFYLSRFGYANYTLFDLPLVNVLSGYSLIMALGDEAVCLEGETPSENKINIRSGNNCRLEPDKKFALALNQDSFPEIDKGIVTGYLNEIHRTASNHFLSINHEVQHATVDDKKHLNVSTLLKNDTRFAKVYRVPYWLRKGFVEELYKIK